MTTSTTDLLTAAAQPPPGGIWPLDQDWAEVFSGYAGDWLTAALQQWLPSRRWFRSKSRTIASAGTREKIAVPLGGQKAFLVFFEVNYAADGPELYVLPLAFAFGPEAETIAHDWPQMILAQVSISRPRRGGVLYDAIVSREFCQALLALMAQRREVTGQAGNLKAEPTKVLDQIRQEQGLDLEPSVNKAEQSNTSVIYDSRVILKFFRRLDAGINPELEIERFLAARNFPYSPALAGTLEYEDHQGKSSALAVLTSFVPGCHDAWEGALIALKHFYQSVQRLPADVGTTPLQQPPLDLAGSYLDEARILGQRTAALHLVLASGTNDPAFRPEPWTPVGQESLVQSLQEMTQHNFQLLRQSLPALAPGSVRLAQQVLSLESLVTQRFQRIIQQPVAAARIRTHGDYHLGQVLQHGPDFLIIDFEGEPALPLEERRSKQSALRDVGGMIYSFYYAANAALRDVPDQQFLETNAENGAAWARRWATGTGTAFLKAYLETARGAVFIPADETVMKLMLEVELLRKAIYELGYELNNRPAWVNVAFQVLLDLLDPDNPI